MNNNIITRIYKLEANSRLKNIQHSEIYNGELFVTVSTCRLRKVKGMDKYLLHSQYLGSNQHQKLTEYEVRNGLLP